MRELYSVTQNLIELFNLDSIHDLGEYIKNSIDNGDFEKLLQLYMDWLGDDTTDWIQAVYQYNQADRDNLKQDYTPPSLSKLLAKMIKGEPETVYDVCSGSGSLTLQIHKQYPNAQYILHELDDNVIPYLLLNLALNDVNATVINGDVLNGDIFKVYHVHNKHIKQLEHYKLTKYDVVVSNPPFNLKNDGNKKFLKHVVDHSINQGLIILYKPPIKHKEEIKYMQHLLDENLLYRIIYNPDRMFTSTTTITSILEVRHNKQNTSIYLQDCTYYKSEETRHQNGQFGGNSHTGRTYHKKFNCYDDEHIECIANIWRGPRTIEWSTNQIKAEKIPLNLMNISNPIGLLYGDSDEIQKALDEKQKALDEKQKKEYQEAIMTMAKTLLAVDLAKEEMHKKLGIQDKKAKWIITYHGFPPEPTTVCSECGFDRDFNIRARGFGKIKYCPGCGRRMI